MATPPQQYFLKINFNVPISVTYSIGVAICWILARNLLYAWIDKFPSRDPLVGEARAALQAISQTVAKGLNNVILGGDSQNGLGLSQTTSP